MLSASHALCKTKALWGGKISAIFLYNKLNSTHEETLNQFLTLMDGFNSSDNIIVIAATNIPEVLDKAIKSKALERHLEVSISNELYDEIRKKIEN